MEKQRNLMCVLPLLACPITRDPKKSLALPLSENKIRFTLENMLKLDELTKKRIFQQGLDNFF